MNSENFKQMLNSNQFKNKYITRKEPISQSFHSNQSMNSLSKKQGTPLQSMRENKNITNTTKQSQISVLQAFTQSVQENMRNKNKVKDQTNDRDESFNQQQSYYDNNGRNNNEHLIASLDKSEEEKILMNLSYTQTLQNNNQSSENSQR